MTKKKNNKQKRQKDVSDTSEEELNEASYQGKCCPHVPRGVNFGPVKRVLKTGNISACNGCADSVSDEAGPPEVWLCLQCGYRGCGRMSTNQHGLQHFKTIHSDCHSLVLSPSSGVVWCYDCDDEVQLQSSRNLRQCVEFIMKLKPNNSKSGTNKTLDDKKSSSNQQSLIEIVLREQTGIKNTTSEVSLKKDPTTAATTNNKNKKENVSPKISVKGLRNLGNTCYFNAVMQNLSQTALLFHVLEESSSKDYKWEVPHLKVVDDSVVEDTSSESVKIALPREFQLVNTFVQFLKKMSAHSQNKVEVINPNDLFGDLQRKSPHFQYHLQQDSHELLRQFLDGIRQDEVKRQKRAILRHFNVINVSPEDIDDDVKKLVKAYSCYASHTVIEKIFGGLLISTVLCEECKMSSQVFEPFMDMSLPLFEEKQQENCDQLCPLLDGGKQETVKAVRIRKPDLDCSESGEEYALNKSKKDYGKPSKHQEKKMKQMEKKEKKKNKKAQGKKIANEIHENSMQDIEDLNNPVDTATENNEQEKDVSNSIETQEPNHINELEEDGEALDDGQATVRRSIPNGDLINGEHSESQEEILSQDENVGTIDNTNNGAGDFISECTVQTSVEDPLVFHEKLLPNGESADASNPTLIKNGEILRLDEELDPESKEDTSESVQLPSSDIADQFEKCVNISSVNSLELDERMHNLSMQVKEVRIRRDSDRQESILSSSQSNDDCDSPKTNHSSYDSFDGKDNEERDENWSSNLSESQTKDWILKSLTTLKCRKQVSPLECSIDTCLMHFTKPELLTGNNKFRCENCSEIKRKKTGNKKEVVYSNASKQLLIFSPPAILTLHLKRFQQVGMSLRKVNRFVEFPLVLDLASYCSSACLILPHMTSVKSEILYSLYGIVEHSGHLRSGHYTAYVKVAKRTINQSFVSQLPLAQCDLEQLLHKFSKNSTSSSEEETEEIASSDEDQWYYISDCHVREATVAQVLKCQAYLLFYERIK